MITIGSLVVAGCGPAQARMFVEPLMRACSRFEIRTPGRIGAFVAQCLVESQRFTHLEENCRWTTPERIARYFPSRVRSIAEAMPLVNNPQRFADVVYAGKNGNGDADSGDGWKYRGRGLIQLTGRGNYERAGVDLGRPYVASPELLSLPDDAALSAAWFWDSRGLNALADAALVDQITRKVNGPAMDQSALRRQLTHEATQAFS